MADLHACTVHVIVPTCTYNSVALLLQVSQEVFIDLDRFGGRLVDEVDALGKQAELEPPYLRFGCRTQKSITGSILITACMYVSIMHPCNY